MTKIIISNRQKDLRISKPALEKAVLALFSYKRVKCHQIAIHLVTKKAISKVHEQFFEDPSPTDCISFPIDPPNINTLDSILGEIFICPKVAIEYAREHGLPPMREFYLYLIHGFLHLLGLDDSDPKSRAAMRRGEKTCLHFLATNGLLPVS